MACLRDAARGAPPPPARRGVTRLENWRAAPRADGPVSGAGGVWLVLPEPLSTRIFFDCGIVDGLRARLGDALRLVSLLPREQAADWLDRIDGVDVSFREDLLPARVGAREKVLRRTDTWLDDRIGFYPLAIRLNLRHGFHLERMQRGHKNYGLDLARVGPLPQRRTV